MLKSLFANKHTVLKVYFVLLRGAYIVGALLAISFLATVFDWFLLLTTVSGLSIIALQFYGSLIAERRFKVADRLGLYLAFGLNTLMLFSLFFPVALLGYYALLNGEMRQQFDKEKNPEWLNNCFKYLEDFENSVTKTA